MSDSHHLYELHRRYASEAVKYEFPVATWTESAAIVAIIGEFWQATDEQLHARTGSNIPWIEYLRQLELARRAAKTEAVIALALSKISANLAEISASVEELSHAAYAAHATDG